MKQREFMDKVNVGDTVYFNTRATIHCGQSAVVLEKNKRNAKLRLEDGSVKIYTFYSIEREPVDEKEVIKPAKVVGNVITCPDCKRVLFDYKNTILDIECAIGRCKHCGQKVKWDSRKAREEAGV